jgi:hypothetical protein
VHKVEDALSSLHRLGPDRTKCCSLIQSFLLTGATDIQETTQTMTMMGLMRASRKKDSSPIGQEHYLELLVLSIGGFRKPYIFVWLESPPTRNSSSDTTASV